MERWLGKVAVVTGASIGIGAAIAIHLTNQGCIVIGLARRKERVENLVKYIAGAKGQLHAYSCDVSNEQSVQCAFDWIDQKFGGINILVNNAGVSVKSTILGDDSKTEDLLSVIDTNINGVLYCTRATHKILRRTGEPGHIVNIGSLGGHSIPVLSPEFCTFNVYQGTKYCLRAITEVLRQELIHMSKHVRISMISPGIVKTGFFDAGGYGDDILKMGYLLPEDISAACLYILGTPPHVQVHDILIRPVGAQY